MSQTDLVRFWGSLLFSGILILFTEIFCKMSSQRFRRYQPVINSGYLLIFTLIYVPIGTLILGREQGPVQMASLLLSVFLETALYYSLLLVVLPLVRRWFSPKAISMLWMLPNFLYISYQSWMMSTPPRFVWRVRPGLLLWLFLVWAAGALAVLGFSVISHLRYRREVLHRAVPVTDATTLEQWQGLQQEIMPDTAPDYALVVSPDAVSPLTIGLSKRTIRVILPDKPYTPEERNLVLRHELIHIAHGDLWLKLTMTVCTALCWFNPLLWLAMKRCAQDAELSCDQMVMEDCGQEKARQYASLILSSVGDQRGFTTCLSADAKALQYRLRGIMRPEKKLGGTVLAAAVLFGLLYLGNSAAVVWEQGTAGELIFENQPSNLSLDSVWSIEYADGGVTWKDCTCLDEAALTNMLKELNLCLTGANYDLREEDGVAIQYQSPGRGNLSLTLREQSLTVFWPTGDAPYRRARTLYYLAEPVDWEQLFALLSPVNCGETVTYES